MLPSETDIALALSEGEDVDLFLDAQLVNRNWYMDQELDTYEEALEKGLYETLKIIKSNEGNN